MNTFNIPNDKYSIILIIAMRHQNDKQLLHNTLRTINVVYGLYAGFSLADLIMFTVLHNMIRNKILSMQDRLKSVIDLMRSPIIVSSFANLCWLVGGFGL